MGIHHEVAFGTRLASVRLAAVAALSLFAGTLALSNAALD